MKTPPIIYKQLSSIDQLNSELSLDTMASFLHDKMVPYEDTREDILRGLRYALRAEGGPGGFVLCGFREKIMVCCGVVLHTGMSGYIPENIILFVCVDPEWRRLGIGGRLMEKLIGECEGSIKLHVEPDNPAKRLYEHVGFTSKYLEMRLHNE